MRKPSRSYLDKIVVLTWRDSVQDNGQIKPKDISADCIWDSYGLVVRESDRFLSVAFGKDHIGGDLADVLSVPWEMVLKVRVLT